MSAVAARTMVSTMVPKRRTDRVRAAIEAELEAKRAALDSDGSVRSVTVIVKLKQGSIEPRAVIVQIETERTLGE